MNDTTKQLMSEINKWQSQLRLLAEDLDRVKELTNKGLFRKEMLRDYIADLDTISFEMKDIKFLLDAEAKIESSRELRRKLEKKYSSQKEKKCY